MSARLRGFALVGLLSLVGCGDAPPPAAPRRSVVVVTLDTTRRDALGFHGRTPSPSPHLDALATQSVVFDDAYTSTPLTLPAHSTLMTGLYPARHGVRENSVFRLPPSAETLAERLQSEGYATAAVVSAFVLDPDFGIAQGFDRYVAPPRLAAASGPYMAERRGDETVDLALEGLGAVEDPFFLWVHLFDPHAPYVPPTPPTDAPAPGQPGHQRAMYDAEIRFADAQIDRLRQGLEARGFDGIFVFAADHGECVEDGKESTHGCFVYDETMRIPLLVHAPGLTPRRVPFPVTLADVTPTLLQWLGLTVEATAFDGLALPLRQPATSPPERVLALESYNVYLQHGWAPFEAVVDDTWKFIHSRRDELYHRTSDPQESANVVAERPEIAPRLRAEVDARFGDDRARLPFDAMDLTSADAERLRQLGYALGSSRGEERPDSSTLPDARERADFLTWIDRATGADIEGRPAEAISLLQRAATEEPESALAHERLGTALLTHRPEALEDAERHLTSAIALHFDRARCHFNLGLCKLRRADESERLAAVRRDAGDGSGAEEAQAAALAQRLDAKLHFECALQCEPSHPQSLANLASLLARFGRRAAGDQDWDLAEELLDEAQRHLQRFSDVVPADHPDVQRFQRTRKMVDESLRRVREARGG